MSDDYFRVGVDDDPISDVASEDSARRYYTQLDPTVYENISSAIENPFQVASRSLVGDPDDVAQLPASTLLEFKNLYTPAELNSIVDAFVSKTGDAETGDLLRNLFGSDTTLSDTAIDKAEKIPLGEGDITTAGYTTTDLNKIGSDATKTGKLNLSDLLKYGLPALGAYASYKSAKDAQKQAAGAKFESRAPVKATKVGGRGVKYSAQGGGIGSLDMAQGGRALPPRYLDGHSDGMADKVPAHIDGKRPAALSDGEFVIPADVVSHLGNGNSNAGAKRLYEMMDRIRSARTGNHKQGKQINPDKFIPR